MGDFEFDIDLLISPVEARPVLWDKTDDIIKRETRRKGMERSLYCFQRDSEALGDV